MNQLTVQSLEDQLATEILQYILPLLPEKPFGQSMNISHPLIRRESFEETHYLAAGSTEISLVEAAIWSDAIQERLDALLCIYIPYQEEAIYLDKPIIMKSGYTLHIHPETEIRLKPHTNTCMIRNESLQAETPDSDIRITGGIWSTSANGKRYGNGNLRGNADNTGCVPGLHGVISIHNATRVAINSLTIKESSYFGIHISNASHFLIGQITFVNHYRDGIHVNGPAEYGLIRNISGQTGDDIIALNAWDWEQYSVTFGSINKILVEGVDSQSGHLWSEIRLLPGTKRFADGTLLVCEITQCIIRRVSGVHTFKIYAQPNLESGRNKDFSIDAGFVDQLFLSDIQFEPFDAANYYCKKDAYIEVSVNIKSLYLHNIEMPRDPGYRLMAFGPMTFMFKGDIFNPEDPYAAASETELFQPQFSCMLQRLYIHNVKPFRAEEIPDLVLVRDLSDLYFEEMGSYGGKGVIHDFIVD